MRGFPKWFNTKQDVLNMMDIDPEETKAYIQRLLNGRFIMTPLHKADENTVLEEGQEFRTMFVREEGVEQEDAVREMWVFGPEVDPNAQLFQLGFTVDEAEKLIA